MLALTLAPSTVPALLKNIPQKYNLMTIRLWSRAFYLIESLHHAAPPNELTCSARVSPDEYQLDDCAPAAYY